MPDLHSDLRKGSISRREFLRMATLLGVSATAAYTLAGCNVAATSIPPPSAAIKRGGTMKIGTAIQHVAHPAQLDWAEGSNLLRQTAEYLAEVGPYTPYTDGRISKQE